MLYAQAAAVFLPCMKNAFCMGEREGRYRGGELLTEEERERGGEEGGAQKAGGRRDNAKRCLRRGEQRDRRSVHPARHHQTGTVVVSLSSSLLLSQSLSLSLPPASFLPSTPPSFLPPAKKSCPVLPPCAPVCVWQRQVLCKERTNSNVEGKRA